MARIDISTLEGYTPDMSAEDKLKLLGNYEIPEPDHTGYISKQLFDKAASELAEAKRQLKAKLTEDEQKEADRAAKEAEREEMLKNLLKEKAVSESKARFLALGYAEDLASEAAAALADNDNEKLFAAQKKYIEAREKAIKGELIKDTPTPAVGVGGKSITKEQFDAMGYTDRLKMFDEQPELYKEFTGGNE